MLFSSKKALLLNFNISRTFSSYFFRPYGDAADDFVNDYRLKSAVKIQTHPDSAAVPVIRPATNTLNSGYRSAESVPVIRPATNALNFGYRSAEAVPVIRPATNTLNSGYRSAEAVPVIRPATNTQAFDSNDYDDQESGLIGPRHDVEIGATA
jgi:hypothetical protein